MKNRYIALWQFSLITIIFLLLSSSISWAQCTSTCTGDPDCENTTCQSADAICSVDNITTGIFSSSGATTITADYNVTNIGETGCLNFIRHPLWLIIQMNNSIADNSTLDFTINNAVTPTDLNFMVFKPLDCCNELEIVRCSSDTQVGPTGFSSTENSSDPYDADGNSFTSALVVNPGETYYILIDNQDGVTDDFNIQWGGTAASGLNCNICELAVEIDNAPTGTVCMSDARDVELQANINNPHPGETIVWSSNTAGVTFDPSPNVADVTPVLPSGLPDGTIVTFELEVTTQVAGNDDEDCIRTATVDIEYVTEELVVDDILLTLLDGSNFTGSDSPVTACRDELIQFDYQNVPADVTVEWDFEDDGTFITGSPTNADFAFNTVGSKNISIRLTNTTTNCSAEETIVVEVQDKLVINSVACEDAYNETAMVTWSAATLVDGTPVTGATYVIQYIINGGTTQTTAPTPDLSFSIGGLSIGDNIDYTIIASHPNFCSSDPNNASASCSTTVKPCRDAADNPYPNSDLSFTLLPDNNGLCFGDDFTFDAEPAVGEDGSDGVFGEVIGTDVRDDGFFDPSGTGTYEVTYTINDAFGCPYEPIVETISVAEGPRATLNFPDPVCTGDEITLSYSLEAGSSAVAEVSWNLGDGIVKPIPNGTQLGINHIYGSTQAANSPLTVTLILTSVEGCQGIATRSIDLVAPPRIENVTCIGSSTNSIDYAWDAVTGATTYDISYTVDGILQTDVVTAPTTTYTIMGLNPNTTITDFQVSVTIAPCPAVSETGPECSTDCMEPVGFGFQGTDGIDENNRRSLCESDSLILTGMAQPTGGIYAEVTAGNDTTTLTDNIFRPSGTGNEEVIYYFTDADDCTFSDTLYLSITRPPASVFNVSATTLCNDGSATVTFTAQPDPINPIVSHTWDFGLGAIIISSSPDNDVVEVRWTTTGLKTVSLVTENAAGCANESIQVDVVEVLEEITLDTPTLSCNEAASSLTEVGFEWSQIPNAEGYTLTLAITDPDGMVTNETVNITDPSTISHVVNNLTQGTNVRASIQAIFNPPLSACEENSAISTSVDCTTTACPSINFVIAATTDLRTTYCLGQETDPLPTDIDIAAALSPTPPATGTGSFTLTLPDGSEQTYTDADLDLTTYAGQTGTFTLVYNYSENGCPYVSNTFVFELFEEPTVSFEIPNSGVTCALEPVTFTPDNPDSDLDYVWTFDGGNPATATTTGSQNVQVVWENVTGSTQNFNVLVEAVDENGCRSDGEALQIEVFDTIPRPQVVCASQTVNSVTFSWSSLIQGVTPVYDVTITNDGDIVQTYDNESTTQHTIEDLDGSENIEITVETVLPGSPCDKSVAVTTSCSALGCEEVDLADFAIPTDFCQSSDPFDLGALGIIPAGGVFELVTSNFLDTTTLTNGILDPAVFDDGRYRLYYSFNSERCKSTDLLLDIDEELMPVIDALPSSLICLTDSVVLNMSGVIGADMVITWDIEDVLSETTIGTNTTQVYFASAGEKEVRVEVQNQSDCIGDTMITVTVVEPIGIPQVSCTNQTSGSVTFEWDVPANGNGSFNIDVFNNSGTLIDQLIGTNETSYTALGVAEGDEIEIRVTALGGIPCLESAEAGIATCEPLPCDLDDPIIAPLPQTTFCSGDPFLDLLDGIVTIGGLPVPDPLVGFFNLIDATNDTIKNINRIDADDITNGTHTLIYTYKDGVCIYESQGITINIGDGIDMPQVSCTNRTNGSVTFEWNVPTNGNGSFDVEVLDASGTVIDQLNGDSQTTYTALGLAEGDEIEILVTALGAAPCGESEPGRATCEAFACELGNPVIQTLPQTAFCTGAIPLALPDDLVTIDGSAVPDPSLGTFNLINSINDTIKNISQIDPDALSNGTYDLVYIYEDGLCTYSSLRTPISIGEPTPISIQRVGGGTSVCVDDNASFGLAGANPSGATGTWTFEGGTPSTEVFSSVFPTVTWDATGTYKVKLEITNADGCISADSLDVVVSSAVTAPIIDCENVSASAANFEWPAVDGALGYIISTTINNVPASTNVPLDATDTNYTQGNLTDGDTVRITIIAQGGDCGDSEAAEAMCILDEICDDTVEIIDMLDQYCPNDDPVDLSDKAMPTGGKFSVVDVTNTADTTQVISFNPGALGRGTYFLIYEIEIGNCSYKDTKTIEVLQGPVAVIDEDAVQEICLSDVGMFNIQSDASFTSEYSWTFENGNPADTTMIGPQPVAVMWDTPGDYRVTLQVTRPNGCVADTGMTVQVIDTLARPEVACAFASANTVNFNWADVPGANGYLVSVYVNGDRSAFQNITDTFWEERNLEEGDEVRLEVITTGGSACARSDTAVAVCSAIDCDPVPITPSFADIYCLKDTTIVLSAIPAGGHFILNNDTLTTFNPIDYGAGIHPLRYHIITDQDCTYSELFDIEVRADIRKDFTLGDQACPNIFVPVDIVGDTTGLTLIWDWDGGTESVEGGALGATWPSGGVKTVSLQISDGNCISEPTIQTILIQQINVIAPDTVQIVEEESRTVTVQGSANYTDVFNYTWEDRPELSCIDCPNPVITPTVSDYYMVTVSDTLGCFVEREIFVEVLPGRPRLRIPTAFSPNDDGKNDVFRVISNGIITNFEMRIHTRWGKEVFYTTDPTKGWTGKIDGEMAPVGTYVYGLQYALEGEENPPKIQFKQGNVSLIR